MTVLYASRQLKQSNGDNEITEQQLYDYVMSCKKKWNSSEKQEALASAIRNLVMLGWMRAQISDSLSSALGE